MGVQYANPPLIEALVEFRFAPGTAWPPTVPGRFAERIQEEFQEATQPPPIQLHLDIDLAEGSPVIFPNRSVFKHVRHDVLIQLSRDVLAINNVATYIGWAQLRPMIETVYRHYTSVVPDHRLEHLAVRYINQIDIAHQSGPVHLENYFSLYPFFDLPFDTFIGFMIGLQFPLPFGSIKIELRTANTEDSNVTSVMLDLECAVYPIHDYSEAAIMHHLDLAHDQLEAMFEQSITPETRSFFDTRPDLEEVTE